MHPASCHVLRPAGEDFRAAAFSTEAVGFRSSPADGQLIDMFGRIGERWWHPLSEKLIPLPQTSCLSWLFCYFSNISSQMEFQEVTVTRKEILSPSCNINTQLAPLTEHFPSRPAKANVTKQNPGHKHLPLKRHNR